MPPESTALPVTGLSEGVIDREDPKEVFKQIISDLFSGLTIHAALAAHLRKVGLVVLRVIRYQHHPVWELRLKRGNVAPGTEADCVRHQTRNFLAGYRVKCRLNDIEVLVVGERVAVSFIWERGVPGMVSFYGGKREVTLGYPY